MFSPHPIAMQEVRIYLRVPINDKRTRHFNRCGGTHPAHTRSGGEADGAEAERQTLSAPATLAHGGSCQTGRSLDGTRLACH
jgi:hypothetical protein